MNPTNKSIRLKREPCFKRLRATLLGLNLLSLPLIILLFVSELGMSFNDLEFVFILIFMAVSTLLHVNDLYMKNHTWYIIDVNGIHAKAKNLLMVEQDLFWIPFGSWELLEMYRNKDGSGDIYLSKQWSKRRDERLPGIYDIENVEDVFLLLENWYTVFRDPEPLRSHPSFIDE